MHLSNMSFLSKFVLLGSENCAASYIQSSEYEGDGQDEFEANVQFQEQTADCMSPMRPHQYVQVIALRYQFALSPLGLISVLLL